MRIRPVAALAGFALAAGITVGWAGGLVPGHAAPGPSGDPIALAWDSPSTGLVWQPGQSASAMGSFVGSPVVVPGDYDSHTLHVRNDGPSAALATVQIVNVSACDEGDSVNTDFDRLLHLTWQTDGVGADMTWRQAIEAGDPTWAVQFDVDQGAEFSVTAGYYFPEGATTGQANGHASFAMHFDVRVTLTGKLDGAPQPQPTPGDSAATGGVLLHSAWSGWAPTLLGLAVLTLVLAWPRSGAQSKIE